MTERALLIKQNTTPQAKVAVTWSGALPYFADRYAIDLLGKNDPHIARLPARLREGFFETIVNYQPGHMKYDYRYSLSLNPDVVAQLWKNQEEASPLLEKTQNIRTRPFCTRLRFVQQFTEVVLQLP